jgi:hypothetical protein
VSWVWVLPACATLGAVVVVAVVLRNLATEARALQATLASWDHLAVAVGDLEHDAHRAGLALRQLTRR